MSQVTSQESFQNFPVSDQVSKSFHIPVTIGATVLTALGVVTLQVYVVGVTGVRGE